MITGSHRVLEVFDILETREAGANSYEVCASGRAVFDEDSNQLQIDLDACLRQIEMRGKDRIFRPAWLPRPDSVKMHVSLEEASDAAKEVFGSWTRKVRKSIPIPSDWSSDPAWLGPEIAG